MTRSKQKGFTLVEFLGVVVLFFGIGVTGWVANIVQMVHHINEPLNAYEIIRIVGIPVAPLGVILGWIGIF